MSYISDLIRPGVGMTSVRPAIKKGKGKEKQTDDGYDSDDSAHSLDSSLDPPVPASSSPELEKMRWEAEKRSFNDAEFVDFLRGLNGLIWMKEIKRYFGDTMSAILVGGEPIPPDRLYKYDVVVTSYHTVVEEYSRMERFKTHIGHYQNKQTKHLPKRPTVTLLTALYESEDGIQKLGKYLILDDAHYIKNTETFAFKAISKLRERLDTCVMMTGTPLDNNWLDSCAFLRLLRGHKITSFRRMFIAFTQEPTMPPAKKTKKSKMVQDEHMNHWSRKPREHYLERIIQLLDAVTLRRPASTVNSALSPVITLDYPITPSRAEIDASNNSFKAYCASIANIDRGDRQANWAALQQAQQHIYHVMLAKFMESEKKVLDIAMTDDASDAFNYPDGHKLAVRVWRGRLNVNDAWRSSRVDAILEVLDVHRDNRGPAGDAIILLDDCIYFLDIVEIAIKLSAEPMPVYRYDGRHDPIQRNKTLEEFTSASGYRILLGSRATAGQGLNIQCANVFIQCGPWWKKSWEEQALCRVFRPGQTKQVFHYKLGAASHCAVERYKEKRADAKNTLNSRIVSSLTLSDGAPLPYPRSIM
ncbi:hypothetical protein ACHAQA_003867 [Verticillium albo-atrum]